MAEESRRSRPPGEEPSREPDHRFSLANERTLLAYERTAIALVAAGVAAVRLLDPGLVSAALGWALVVTGAIAAAVGYHRFRGVDRAMRHGEPLPRNRGVELLVAAIAVCVVAAAVAVALA